MAIDIPCSDSMKRYFEELNSKTIECFDIATRARMKNVDPCTFVEIKLAKNMAERVVGLISSVAPQIENSGVVERIEELEKQYGALDWRVAFFIAREIAEQKFCKFKTSLEAIEVGIRTGFAYVTVGVVSSPLEGFTDLEIKKRMDGKGEYFCINYAGPVRNAGGTAAACSVLIADYVRVSLGYATYDPTPDEIKRCATELDDYHTYVTNLQYKPHEKESDFLLEHLPVEISGISSEDRDVSNYKDLPRVSINKIRSGYCLIHSSCVPLKAEKLWKQLSKWGKDMNMEHWSFLGDYCKLKKELHDEASKKKSSANTQTDEKKPKVVANNTFIMDLVSGRPVIGHPMAKGGLRLRYGRSRVSGFSGQAMHPATMHVLDDFIAIGTQLKVERPGKAATYNPCDTIEGPIVRLKNGNLVYLDTSEKAIAVKKEVEEIIFLGDVLINHGDFLNRAHQLIPPGYCEEWWILELKEKVKEKDGKIDVDFVSQNVGFNVSKIFSDAMRNIPSYDESKKLCDLYGCYMHPRYTLHYLDVSSNDIVSLIEWLKTGNFSDNKFVVLLKDKEKKILENIGCVHLVSSDNIVIEYPWSNVLIDNLDFINIDTSSVDISKNSLDIINLVSKFKLRDKSGIYIGARMGRPEKAKLRKMHGSPHGLFPVGKEGGRMHTFSSTLEKGFIESQFSIKVCESCGNETIYNICEKCSSETKQYYYCKNCGRLKKPCNCKMGERSLCYSSMLKKIEIKHYFKDALKKLNMNVYPDLIKGVEVIINREKNIEHLCKAILRAKHGLHVNKDGTIRYDASEMTLTHFKPSEIGTSVEKLKEMGYEKDCYGKELVSDGQILEIKPQDCILPACPISPNERANDIMFKTMQFIDELLVSFYGEKSYYNAKSLDDCIGQYLIGLAPHTSAGILMRCIGFTKSQGFLAHPLLHCAMRRDVDGDETCFFLLLDGFLNFSMKYLPESLGSTMDAPLVLTSVLNPKEVDDMCFDCDRVWEYGLDFYNACLEYKMPWEVKIDKIGSKLGTPEALEGMGFTHDTSDFNDGVLCSAYKTLPTMEEKLNGQMNLAKKIRSVDARNVAMLVINKHFLKDIKGNLRKFSQQSFRCVSCNTIYRRPPLKGYCPTCNGKIIFTVAPGSVVKYVDYCINMSKEYKFDTYFSQTIELMKLAIDSVFGKEKEIQTGLSAFM
jgi:DNA polymerase II large subunit